MLEVTETALTNVKKYLSDSNIESAVRITMISGGCSGNSLGLALDEAKENDLTSEQDGVNFLVEKALAETCGTLLNIGKSAGHLFRSRMNLSF